MTPSFHNLIQKRDAERILSNPFYENRITLIQKLGEEIIRKEKYRPISLMDIDVKILKKY